MQSSRRKPPFGIAQTGKSFRNEITPGNFIFRTREFEQMEMEFFVKPGEDEEWHQYWIDERTRWYVDLGIDPDNLRHYEHAQEKLSHYSKRTVDIEYRFRSPAASGASSRASRTARTSTSRRTASTRAPTSSTSTRRAESATRRTSSSRRPSLALAHDLPRRRVHRGRGAEHQGRGRQARRAQARQALAPVKAAVLPLSRNADLSPKARDLAATLRRNWNIDFDDAGAIGRRYRRQDEIGTPFCITVDFDTLEDHAVTIRERDTMTQERVALDQVEGGSRSASSLLTRVERG